MASSARFFSISIFSAFRFASAAAASASAAACATSASICSSDASESPSTPSLSSSSSSSTVPAMLSESAALGSATPVEAENGTNPDSNSSIPSTSMSASNMFEFLRIPDCRLGMPLRTPIVKVPSTITSRPSSGSIGGGWMMPLPLEKSTSRKSSASLGISRSKASIFFLIDSALRIKASPTVNRLPVPPASPMEVMVPTCSSSLLPRA
mmetsp:Transcript_84837/g.172018  ORF Transcript_84837/g.172018 Transcript_84837/m.172018 type:complete len:209 (+) Transcript_84837:398-1024(+)